MTSIKEFSIVVYNNKVDESCDHTERFLKHTPYDDDGNITYEKRGPHMLGIVYDIKIDKKFDFVGYCEDWVDDDPGERIIHIEGERTFGDKDMLRVIIASRIKEFLMLYEHLNPEDYHDDIYIEWLRNYARVH